VKKTTRITVETKRVVIVSGGRGFTLQWCASCEREVKMLVPEYAAMLANIRTRLIYRWVETGRLHFTEGLDGQLLVCINSLPDQYGPEPVERRPMFETVLKT
jgi:hypothetical protein